MLRDIAVWLGAPMIASLFCTAVWSAASGSQMADLQVAISLGLGALFFTVVGSAMASLLFAGMNSRPIRHRYLSLLMLGGPAGGATMLFLGSSLAGVTAGALYGLVTACVWVGLHALIALRAESSPS
jgi:hypothetical protein